MRGGMSVPWGEWVFQGDGSSRGDGCSRGMGVPGGWVFQGDECSRGMSVLDDGCLGGWEFLIPWNGIYSRDLLVRTNYKADSIPTHTVYVASSKLLLWFLIHPLKR